MTSPPLPETFALLGIVLFAILSLITAVLDGYFSDEVPYAYQIIAFTGMGQLYVSRFVLQIPVETRTILSVIYLIAALVNVGALNIFIAHKRERPLPGLHLILFGALTLPTVLITLLLASGLWELPIIPLPTFLVETIHVLTGVSIITLGVSLLGAFRPHLDNAWRRLSGLRLRSVEVKKRRGEKE